MTKPTNPHKSKKGPKKTYKKGPAVEQPQFDAEGNVIKTVKTESQKESEKRWNEENQKKMKKYYMEYKEKGGYKHGGKLKNRYPGGGRYQHD